MKTKLIVISIIIIFILMVYVLLLFVYSKTDIEIYKVIDIDYYNSQEYQNHVLDYNQFTIDQYINTPNISVERAVEIAELVFNDYYSELNRPYLVYIDEENNVYIIIAEFIDSDTKIKIILDKNTGGFLLIQRLAW